MKEVEKMNTDKTMEILKEMIRDNFYSLRVFEKEENIPMMQFIVYENLSPLIELLGKCIGTHLTIDWTDKGYRLMTVEQFMAQ